MNTRHSDLLFFYEGTKDIVVNRAMIIVIGNNDRAIYAMYLNHKIEIC